MFKFYKFFIGIAIFLPGVAGAAGVSDFNMAAQLLSAARNGNTRLVQNLINSGANVNYVDSTGLSVVCTAVMNNDTRAVQVLQMYGADASQCDRQIKNYNARNNPVYESGLFSGLPSTHKLVLGTVGVGAVIGGLFLLTDVFDDGHGGGGNGGSGSNNNNDNSDNDETNSLSAAFTVPYGPAMVTSTGVVNKDFDYTSALNMYSSDAYATNFGYMNANGNYLLMMHGYAPFARGYMGQTILRYANNSYAPVPSAVFSQSKFGDDNIVTGGIPLNVALVTANGINAAQNTSLEDRFFVWSTMNNSAVANADNYMISSKYFNNAVTVVNNSSLEDDTVAELSGFDFSGDGTAIGIAKHNDTASETDDLLAKIVGGYTSGAATGDFIGFLPNGQLTIYRTGGGQDIVGNDINYYNYRALVAAAGASVNNSTTAAEVKYADYGRAKISVIANADVIEPLHATNVKTVDDLIGVASENYQTKYYDWVSNYYGNGVATPTGVNTPQQDAQSFFTNLGVSYFPITVFSTGASQTDSEYSDAPRKATFENAAPLAFTGAQKLFMSVVGVNLPTTTADSVTGFAPANKYSLSQWQDTDTSKYYKSRICGISGVGAGGVDPWCFAAAGMTDEQAVAVAAGATGAVKAAFSYMSNQNIFTLLALTADGAYLGTNPSTGNAWDSTNDLVSYLSSMYALPQNYQLQVDSGTISYLDAFKQVFGYGLINLDRATMPGKSVYYYSNGKIVSSGGNAYWRSASVPNVRNSAVFGARAASVPVSVYDVLTSVDGSISVPRVWNMNLSFGNDFDNGFYLGDTLAELKTRDEDNTVNIGDFKFGFARSEKFYDDNMSGIDNLSLGYDNGRFGFKSEYQHYLTDNNGRFSGRANAVLALVSNAVSSGVELHDENLTLSGRGFIGNITTDGLLENDPAVSSNFAAAKLGDVMGAESGIKFGGDKLSVASNIGTMHESNTVLGALWGGMMDVSGADTYYVDSVASYNITDDIGLMLRGTFAWTNPGNIANGIINNISELKSNSFAAGVRLGNFDLTASMPLALTDGKMYYSYADFVVGNNNELLMKNAGERSIDLTPEHREYRFNASYRHKFGDWTDGALGFIYRINPNNTDEFGNESIFMMKLSHRLGI